MSLDNTIDSIESDIQQGRKLKAADRLRNLINEHPNNLELWNRLAELYFESGFLDAAGRYWILTEPTDQRIKSCVEIYEESVNHSGYQILQDIKFRGNKTKLPPYARNKLEELEADSKKQVKHVPTYTQRKPEKGGDQHKRKRTVRDHFIAIFLLILLLGITSLVIIGLIEVIGWVLRSPPLFYHLIFQ